MQYCILSGTNHGFPILVTKEDVECEPEKYTEDHTALFDTQEEAEEYADNNDLCMQCGHRVIDIGSDMDSLEIL